MSKAKTTTMFGNLQGDRVIWLVVALLSLFSLLAIYSATGTLAFRVRGGDTEYYLFKRFFYLVVGLAIMYLCYRIPYTKYSKMAPVGIILSIFLLVITLMFGVTYNGATRWLEVPILGVTFQTSDLAKVTLIAYIARTISAKQDYIKDFNSAFLPILAPVLVVCGLIAPADLSSALLLFGTCMIMMFVGRVDVKFIGLLILLGIVLFAFLIILGEFFPGTVRVETWVSRIKDFFVNSEGAEQIQRAKMAIADGGWLGVGPGNSVHRNFLPHAYSDVIYAFFIEEYGLVGGLGLIVLYLTLLFRCVSLVTRSPKAFGAMLVLGLCLSMVLQALFGMAVSVHLIPVTGLPLPMMSMGGTSLLFSCIMFGMILSVSRYVEKTGTERKKKVKEEEAPSSDSSLLIAE